MNNPIFRGMLTGLITAAAVDFHAFKTWHTFGDVKQFDWITAIIRWTIGAVTGALTGAGFSV
jgi:hypothetical protein